MKPKGTSVRFTPYTQLQIMRLCERHGLTQTAVLTLAVERFDAQTGGEHPETEPMVSHYQAQPVKGE